MWMELTCTCLSYIVVHLQKAHFGFNDLLALLDAEQSRVLNSSTNRLTNSVALYKKLQRSPVRRRKKTSEPYMASDTFSFPKTNSVAERLFSTTGLENINNNAIQTSNIPLLETTWTIFCFYKKHLNGGVGQLMILSCSYSHTDKRL